MRCIFLLCVHHNVIHVRKKKYHPLCLSTQPQIQLVFPLCLMSSLTVSPRTRVCCFCLISNFPSSRNPDGCEGSAYSAVSGGLTQQEEKGKEEKMKCCTLSTVISQMSPNMHATSLATQNQFAFVTERKYFLLYHCQVRSEKWSSVLWFHQSLSAYCGT